MNKQTNKGNRFFLYSLSLILAFGMISLLTLSNGQITNAIKSIISPTHTVLAKEKDPEETSKENGEIIPLEQDDITLKSVYDSRDFYFTLPHKSVGNNSYIELIISSSDLLKEELSSLTVLVNDQPIQSIPIKEKLEFKSIKVPLQKDYLTDGVNKISIQTQMYTNADMCLDQMDPSNWVILHETSYAFLDTKEAIETKDLLSKYPYPFITPGTQDEIHTSIVIPNNSSGPVMKAALQMGNYLSKQTSKQQKVPVMFENEWDASKNEHVIALGVLDSWEEDMNKTEALKDVSLQGNELYVHNVRENKENKTRQILFITANTEETLIEKSVLLTNDKLAKQLTGNSLKIGRLPDVEPTTQKAQRTLPIVNERITLNDTHLTSEAFYVDIPSYWNEIGEATLDVSFRASPLLKEWDNEELNTQLGITIYVNDVPFTIPLASFLDSESENEKNTYNYSFTIPQELLLSQELVKVSFEFNNPNTPDGCQVRYKSGNWITIENDTMLDVPHEVNQSMTFNNWPAMFTEKRQNSYENVAFVIPKDMQENGLSQLALLVNNLANTHTFNNFKIVRGSVDDLDAKTRSDYHIILLKAKKDDFLGNKEKLTIPWSNSNELDLSPFGFVTETANYLSWIQPSIWNSDKTMVIFKSLVTNKEAPYLHEDFFDYLKELEPSEQNSILVINKENEAFAFANEEITNDEETIQEVETNHTTTLIIIFSVILLVATILFFIIWRRKRKNG